MLCPTCKIPLVMAERQGVEIDYCPTCRGVWLDRGELDKIIERAASADRDTLRGDDRAEAREAYGRPTTVPPRQPYHPPDPRHEHRHGGHHGKRRKSFLSEMFDFD